MDKVKKNRLQRSDSKLLLDILLKRSTAWKDLCDMSWDNDTQSDDAAATVRDELESVLTDLLKGNYEPVTRKLTEHARRPPLMTVRPIGAEKQDYSEGFYPLAKTVRIGDNDALIVTMHSNEATGEELVYGVVRRALDSGDIKHLALCRNCKAFFYRNSNKGKSCGATCRWRHFNNAEGRADEAHDRYVKLMKKKFPAVRVARRPRRKAHGN